MVVDVIESEEIQSEPSYAPPCEDSDASAFDYISRQSNLRLDVCQPAIVKSYDREKNIVTVAPAVMEATATGEFIQRSEIDVPVFSPCGGGFVMNFPLKEGDTGWLLCNDRDISLFKQQRTVINPNTYRIHSLEDSFFIPDRVNKFEVDNDDKENLVIQSLDKSVKIVVAKDTIQFTTAKTSNGQTDSSVSSTDSATTSGDAQATQITIGYSETGFHIKTSTNVVVECKNLTAKVQENANITAQNINLEGNIVIKGNVSIDGNTDCSGTVKGSAVKAGSIDLQGHVHGGVENGSGTTGAAQ